MELQRLLEQALEDGPQSVPLISRAVVRGRLRETRQRPGWLVRERGDAYPLGGRFPLRLVMMGASLMIVLGLIFAP
jgi:hypothetical protein